MLGAVLQSLEQHRWRWTLLAVGVGLTPVAWNYGCFYYRRYRYIRWGFQPGAISGYLARILENHSRARRNDAPVRVYMDGCFDMMHYGHANALRQARACGDVLVVGLIPDHEIEAVKGPPVMNNEERLAMVESVKWVDEVITDAPYEITEGFMTELFEKHHIDVIVHGDDPCLLPVCPHSRAPARAESRRLPSHNCRG